MTTKDLEFYDLYKKFPYQKKKIVVTLPVGEILKFKNKNLSKTLTKFLIKKK